MKFSANCLELESDFDVDFELGFLRVRWEIRQLGGAYPGGDWLVKDPVLEFQRSGGAPVRVQLIPAGHPARTLCGLSCFRRMREIAMPATPWSYAVNLPAGDYTVRFTGELYDCRRLVRYCDALQIFAGHFSLMVEKFEEHCRYWQALGHGDAGAAYHWPIDLTLGALNVPRDYTCAPRYFTLNEVELQPMKTKGAPAAAATPHPDASPLRTEN
jgi:hypothetical protein